MNLENGPKLSQFLSKSPLASQMKIAGDQVGDAIRIEGELYPLEELTRRFSCVKCRYYGEPFIMDKESGAIYTYLGGGQGLVPHHPYKSYPGRPVAHLSQDHHKKLLKRAQSFGREGEEILQIVSCGHPKSMWLSKQHVFLRFIDKSGAVYSFGFGYLRPQKMLYSNHRGILRSPDIYEYRRKGTKVVTSLTITPEERERLFAFIKGAFSQPKEPVFNLFSHNCASFVRLALESACGLTIPSQSTFVIQGVRKLMSRFERLCQHNALHPAARFLKEIVQSSLEVPCSLLTSLVGLALGASRGYKGRSLASEKTLLTPPAQSAKWWFDLGAKSFDYPHKVRKWQLAQPSTQIFSEGKRLAI